MLRTFARAISSIFPTPPSGTVLPAASAKPLDLRSYYAVGCMLGFRALRDACGLQQVLVAE